MAPSKKAQTPEYRYPSLKLTRLNGTPVTVNFNHVSLREKSAAAPALLNHFAGRVRELNRPYGIGKFIHVKGEYSDALRLERGCVGTGFGLQEMDVTDLTLVNSKDPVTVLQTPDQIEKALRAGVRDLHRAGTAKFDAYVQKQDRRLQRIVKNLCA